MGGFDDELRAALCERAGRVEPAVDPVPAIERRARRIRRRRAVTAGAGGVLAIGLIAAGVPYVATQATTDREHEPARIAAAAPNPADPPLTPLPSRPAPEVPAAPGNQLEWPTRGYRPQGQFQEASEQWYARHVGDDGDTTVRRHTLWSGPLPNSQWAALEQYWNPRGDRWTSVLLVARRDGSGLHAAYENVTTFNHQRPHESASLSNGQVGRIAGYGFGFPDFVLVVGSPEAEEASITLDGRTVHRSSLVRGAAVFESVKRGPIELFQLRDDRGRLLTPNDHRGVGYGRRGAAIQGWILDRR